MSESERTRMLVARANAIRAEHRKAVKCLATTLVVIGAYLGIIQEMHTHGFIVEVIGLYLVELV